MKKTLLLLCLLNLAAAVPAQRRFAYDLWPGGLPNTNGIDHQPEDAANRNYKPRLMVALPDSAKATGRAIIILPGGGYNNLAINTDYADPYDLILNRMGIACIVLRYRMPRGHREVPISDAEEAVRQVRRHAAQWGINPNDVGVMGFSAGGHLASVLCTHAEVDARPDFQILFYPDITMDKKAAGLNWGMRRNLLGSDIDNDSIRMAYSSETQVRRHVTPPTLIFAANDDATVPVRTNAVAYYNALRTKNIPAAMYIYPEGGHGFWYHSFPFAEDLQRNLSSWLQWLKRPKAGAVKVACIGNSITQGSMLYNQETDAYPAQLQRVLGTDYHVRNFGVGARVMLNSGDYPYMNEYVWRDCLKWQPDVVVIKLGTNDSKPKNWTTEADFCRDAQQMIDSLNALPSHPRILLALPLPSFHSYKPGHGNQICDSLIVRHVLPAVRKVAKRNKLTLIDLHTPFEGHSDLFVDGVHPNPKGAARMAQIIAPYVKKEASVQPKK